MNKQSAVRRVTASIEVFYTSAKSFSMLAVFCLLTLQPLRVMAQFANGADVGWLSQMEADRYVFKDDSGIQKNCLDILKEKGINALRFRVWVNPSGAYCSKKDVAYMAHRADSMGFSLLIDFHCSDTWADPSHQAKPAAWANDPLPKLLTDLYNHVYSVLDTLKSLGVVPKWVQIGNETNNGMLWPTGKATDSMANFAKMIDTGYAAAKAVDSSIQVIVHLSNGHDDAMYRRMFDGLKSNGARWDIIGMSVYPYWAQLPWATDDSLALITMNDVIVRYNTKVMVVEAGYLYNDPINANHYLLDLIAKTKSAGGLGVFYWEPECYNWQGYQLGAWDPATEKPTVAMNAFLGINATLVNETESISGYNLYVYPNPFNPSTTIEYGLPTSSNVSIVIYNVLGEEVARLLNARENGGQHGVVWSTNNVPSGVYFCRMISGNFMAVKKIVLIK
ncbi:MAG TPA: glycosyl hydrolase 53 family protein [Candidatus Acidoferrales bacterium]|nr:glycosyl hydrolase 53 family protein [Candidatus Acidoferrales bacterium]